MDLDSIFFRVLFDGIKSLSIPELVVYTGIFCLWIVGIANLFFIVLGKNKGTKSLNLKRYLTVSFLLILLKFALFEFLNYQVKMHKYWYKLQHLLIPDAMVAGILGGLNEESFTVYRLSFYIGIVVMSFLFALPLLGERLNYSEILRGKKFNRINQKAK